MEHAALSAPVEMESEEILSRIILVVSVASMIGSGWIIISFLFVPSLRTFRHQLILGAVLHPDNAIWLPLMSSGLGISEFLAAGNVVILASVNTVGIEIWDPSLKAFCSFNGLMVQTFVVQVMLADYWILSIAICTYLILMDYAHAASWVQNHRAVIWCMAWGLSILWGVLGLVVVGYGYAGGWCWFTSDRVRLFVNFIPRWTIILVIMGIYTRLCLLLYRSHKAISSDHELTLQTPHPHQWQLLDISDGPSQSTHSSIPLRKMMVYPTVYALVWIIPTSVRVYQGMTGKRAPLALEILEKVIETSHGFP
ncbi:hypothetical protein AnigIFM60653_007075 [Aspergillus niger]|uniref:Uncharacterized protein n=1 Tax=Aspergillus welwitschiae TaxID=1341132 RepID=A0A3F3PW66_9EURO|nr:hypothetical protein BDQ94DRAFT_160776 [Aspergillus welwitschiae]RDH31194.1 hypothetical protein BDQ94DRAFT_160776 [Aspergillus welwitschiae]GLA00008.1 hypothetical protein AnigIFM60653_007075 [Aspergillus niger]